MTATSDTDRRHLSAGEISRLQKAGCSADDWARITVHPAFNPERLRRVEFIGSVSIGRLDGDADLIADATLADCMIGNHPHIHRVGLLQGATIGRGVRIERCGRISYDPEASCGLGLEVCALDESGSRPVHIYPGLSAQAAMLMAFRPQWTEEVFRPRIAEMPPLATGIGDDAVVSDTGIIRNVHIGSGTLVEGASHLEDGALISNAPPSGRMAYIGSGVDARGFIIEDGSADTGSTLRNCYVGQGASLDKGFTAHDSLFFANCAMENGEACAVIAAPFTVSMHKSTLLIGGVYSFFNAGSATNASNHMYKVGPVHWGVMERGVKTSSGAYIMWGGRIGAFSLLMGQHKKHPDTSVFPFSYVFGTEGGETIVLPARMLGSCGLQRDALKWPTRDRRVKARVPRHDRIVFDPLNPVTIGRVLEALRLSDKLLADNPGMDIFRLDGFKVKAQHLSAGRKLYRTALLSYLHTHGAHEMTPRGTADTLPEKWIDLGGLPVPATLPDLFTAGEDAPADPEKVLDGFMAGYEQAERRWIESFLTPELRDETTEHGAQATADLEAMRTADRAEYVATVAEEGHRFSI